MSNAVKHNRPGEGFGLGIARANGAKLELLESAPGTTVFAVSLG